MKRVIFYMVILGIALGLIVGIVMYAKRDVSQVREYKAPLTDVDASESNLR